MIKLANGRPCKVTRDSPTILRVQGILQTIYIEVLFIEGDVSKEMCRLHYYKIH